MACAHMLSTARKHALDAPPSHIAPPTFTMFCCSCAHYIARSLCCSECCTLQQQKGHTNLNDNSIKELCRRNAPTITIVGCVLCHNMHANISIQQLLQTPPHRSQFGSSVLLTPLAHAHSCPHHSNLLLKTICKKQRKHSSPCLDTGLLPVKRRRGCLIMARRAVEILAVLKSKTLSHALGACHTFAHSECSHNFRESPWQDVILPWARL